MSNKILVTDSLFIKDSHVKILEDAGFEVERLDKPKATEEELIQAIKGKVGYILGGVEHVTKPVIDAADGLKAIVFTGTGWDGFIEAHEYATEKGIAIGSAPHLNAHAVAEFGMTMTLVACREVMDLARGGSKTFETTRSLSEMKLGIVGLGHIGSDYANMAKGLGVTNLNYFSRTKKPDSGITYLEKSDLFASCDLIFVALPVGAGERIISAEDIQSMKKGSIIVSIADPKLFDLDAIYGRLKAGEIRGAFDENIHEDRFRELPLGVWFTPNESSAFNTGDTIERVSSSCVNTLINLLKTGDDQYLMNPEYRQAKHD